jgi:ATP-dependent Lhr-like helicase
MLQGAPIPASVLEVDVLASRIAGYREADLDALSTAGEVVWVGGGALGPSDGRVRLFFRDQVDLYVTPPTELVEGAVHDVLRSHLAERGASFWPDLVSAVAASGLRYEDEHVLAALWDLVWAGEVTNDSFAPLRALASGTRRRSRGAKGTRRPRPGRLTRLGPPTGAGRWSAVASWCAPADPVEAAHARALQLLERHGVLTREAALAEAAPGGFAGIYPVLQELEARGQIRRGYFVAGLGAAQFALPGAVDRLRSGREPHDTADDVLVLAATDPAQPYGATLAWPSTEGRPSRTAGAFVVISGGVPLVFLERGGRSLTTFSHAANDPRWADALARLVKDGRLRSLQLARIDASPAAEHDLSSILRDAGFVDGYRGLVFRA